MTFTSAGLKGVASFIRLLLPCFFLLLAACAGQPEQPQELADKAATATTSPNPYLADREPVPGAARSQFETALKAMDAKQWAQAEPLLRSLSDEYPQLSGPPLNLALVYVATDRKDEADAAFLRAIAANPRNVEACNRYALQLREWGRFAEAEQQYQAALAIWPDYPAAHRNLGILYDLYMGQPQRALELYERYQSLLSEPDHQVAGWIADLRRRLGLPEPVAPQAEPPAEGEEAAAPASEEMS